MKGWYHPIKMKKVNEEVEQAKQSDELNTTTVPMATSKGGEV